MPKHLPPVARLIAGAAGLSCLTLASATDGIVHIRGAIVESGCTVSTNPLQFSDQQVAHSQHPDIVVDAPFKLNMRCHARQSVHVSFSQPEATGANNRAHVKLVLYHDGQPLSAGQAIPLAVAPRSIGALQMRSRLLANPMARPAAPGLSSDPGEKGEKMRSVLLVGLNYH